jgi:SAM-dependent methyltransferase
MSRIVLLLGEGGLSRPRGQGSCTISSDACSRADVTGVQVVPERDVGCPAFSCAAAGSRLPQTVAMDHADHVRLLRDGVHGGGTTWADLGSGEGAFTLALADLLGPTGSIHTVDRDGRAVGVQVRALRDAFPGVGLTPVVADFTLPLELPPLDGIVMANSLHFVRDKLRVLGLVRGYLRPAGRLVLVEYDTDHGNPWVPYPLTFRSWATLASEAGFRETRRLGSVPSRFLGSIYSAVSLR